MADETRPRKSLLRRSLDELGLTSLLNSPRDVKLLCLQRFVRLFAYGASTLVLVSYLQALGITKTQTGLFMTLTLAGDVCISLALTLAADALGRKAVLAAGAALMAGSGVVFATQGHYWVLLAAAVLGVVSPSGNEVGPFRAVEESVVAHLTPSARRGDVYAWYSLSGTAGAAFGLVACGWATQHLIKDLHWAVVDAYRVVFYGYAVLGLVKFVLAVMLSSKVEAEKKKEVESREEEAPFLDDDDNDGEDAAAEPTKPKPRKGIGALLPEVSRESVNVMISLCFLFGLDAFASGLAPL